MTKIRVRIGHSEAEVESDPEHLREAIDLVPDLLSKLPKTDREVYEQKVNPEAPIETLDRQLSSQFPIVNLEKGDSLADVIGKFFLGPWGRDKRKLSDVRDALQSYGLNYPKQSVAVALLRLAKTTKLRRFKAEDGEYVYTSAINLPGVSLEGREHVLDELAATSPS
jgi:hypothetical protein